MNLFGKPRTQVGARQAAHQPWVRGKRSRYESSDSLAPPVYNSANLSGSELQDWAFLGATAAGVAVTELTAMQVSAVYASVALIGGAIASMPLTIYQRTGDGREKADHDVWWLLNEQPNPDYSAAIFWESMVSSLLLHGDAFAIIHRADFRYPAALITGLEWIPTPRVSVRKESEGLIYSTISAQGQRTDHDDADILHIPGPGFNGLRGLSQIQYVLRQSAGIALAADEYSANFFQNGARPDFVIQHPSAPTKEQEDKMREAWELRYQGVKKAHKPAILTGGAQIKELTMNAEDSQLIATRQFQVEDIARIFGVPPHLIGHTQNNTSWGTGVEQMSIGFVKYTLSRHLTKIEQEINRKVWPVSQKYFAEFNTAGLERGDYKTRNEGYRIALGRAGEPGWMTTNEIRRIENMPPVDGGDVFNAGLPAPLPAAA